VSEYYLIAEKKAYRNASLWYDYFISGVSAALLIASAILLSPGSGLSISAVLEIVALLLFAISLVAGFRKLQQTTMILGTSCTILETQMNAGAATTGPAAGITNQLNLALEIVSQRAARSHKLQYWFLVAGLVVFVAARVVSAFTDVSG